MHRLSIFIQTIKRTLFAIKHNLIWPIHQNEQKPRLTVTSFTLTNTRCARHEGNTNHSALYIVRIFIRIEVQEKTFLIRDPLTEKRVRGHTISDEADWITEYQLGSDAPVEPAEIGWMSKYPGTRESSVIQCNSRIQQIQRAIIIEQVKSENEELGA